MKRKDNILLALKAARKQSREDEIKAYGKPINHSNVYINRKKYTRKRKHKTNY